MHANVCFLDCNRAMHFFSGYDTVSTTISKAWNLVTQVMHILVFNCGGVTANQIEGLIFN